MFCIIFYLVLVIKLLYHYVEYHYQQLQVNNYKHNG